MKNKSTQGRPAIRSETMYLTILKTALDGFCMTDMHGYILEVNDTYCRMSGYAETELLAMHISDIEAEEPEDDVAARVHKIMEQGEDRFETRHRRKDGSLFDVEVTVQFQHIEAGRMVAFLRDITLQNQAKVALRQSEAFTKAVLDNLPIGIAVNSMNTPVTFEYMNDNFPGFYRTTREKLTEPDSFWSAVYEDPVFREKIRKKVLDDCASGDPQRMYWENIPITRRDEKTAYITACNIPVPDKQLLISMVWDVTERKLAEEAKEKLQARLIQAQKMESVGRLAGGVAHDFNNMLNVILGIAELAMERIDPADSLHLDLQQIREAARRSAELTRQLLAFARQQTIALQVIDLNTAVEGLLKMLQRLLGENIDLIWRPGSEVCSVKMDPVQLDQILANLCVNARDAIADVGRITIETGNIVLDAAYCNDHTGFVPGEYVLLTVSDDGSGMEKKILDKIFEPFFTTKSVGKGTGLGLATVYGIVKQNNGFINVYSEAGQGTIFRIYLPRHMGDSEPIHPKGGEETMLRGRETVLLVEDEPALLDMTTRMLESLDYGVLPASSPAEALRLSAEHHGKIDLLMTDVVMPGMNGQDLSRKLLSLRPDLKFLFMSGYTSSVINDNGIVNKGVYFIQKPFSRKDLAEKIREAIAAAG